MALAKGFIDEFSEFNFTSHEFTLGERTHDRYPDKHDQVEGQVGET